MKNCTSFTFNENLFAKGKMQDCNVSVLSEKGTPSSEWWYFFLQAYEPLRFLLHHIFIKYLHIVKSDCTIFFFKVYFFSNCPDLLRMSDKKNNVHNKQKYNLPDLNFIYQQSLIYFILNVTGQRKAWRIPSPKFNPKINRVSDSLKN